MLRGATTCLEQNKTFTPIYKTNVRGWNSSEEHMLLSNASVAGKRFSDPIGNAIVGVTTDTSKDNQYIYPVNVRHPSSGSRKDPDTASCTTAVRISRKSVVTKREFPQVSGLLRAPYPQLISISQSQTVFCPLSDIGPETHRFSTRLQALGSDAGTRVASYATDSDATVAYQAPQPLHCANVRLSSGISDLWHKDYDGRAVVEARGSVLSLPSHTGL